MTLVCRQGNGTGGLHVRHDATRFRGRGDGGCGVRNGAGDRPRPGLSHQAGPGGGALSGGRRHGSGGASGDPAPCRPVETDRHHRQQGRRQRHPGQRDRRQGSARWLHAAGHDQRAHDQSLHDQGPTLRHRARLHAGHAADRGRSRAGRLAQGGHGHDGKIHGGGARQSWKIPVRQHRKYDAHGGRAVPAEERAEDRERGLPARSP